jgi:hypothetical protein
MSTIVVNPGDVIVVNDSIAVKMSKVTEILQPVVQGAETNCEDVMIAAFICIAIVLVVLIVRWTICSWKNAEIKAVNVGQLDKESDADIAERKQKADALNKLLDYLAKNTTEEKYDDNAGKMIKLDKGIDSAEGQYYIEVLRSVIKGDSIPQYPLKKEDNEDKKTKQN